MLVLGYKLDHPSATLGDWCIVLHTQLHKIIRLQFSIISLIVWTKKKTLYYEEKPPTKSQRLNKVCFTIIHLFDVNTVLSSANSNLIRAHKLRFKYVFCFFYLIHHFKIQAQSGGGVETAHLPLACSTNTYLLRKTDNHRRCDEWQ